MADNRSFYNEILIDHNMHPAHKHELPDADMEMRGYNPTCGDDITMKLKVENGIVIDGAFQGSGCVISQASADMMLIWLSVNQRKRRCVWQIFFYA